MSSVSLRSHKRLRSAGGRLQTLAAEQEGEGRARGERKSRRVRSARETRQAHESSSEIFPQVEEGEKDSSWGRTQYDDDYGPKQPVTPVPVRPVSPTRRHNPHPAQVRERILCVHCNGVSVSIALGSCSAQQPLPRPCLQLTLRNASELPFVHVPVAVAMCVCLRCAWSTTKYCMYVE